MIRGHRTPTTIAAIGGGMVVFAVALIFGRADVAILGIVPIVAATLAAAQRTTPPTVEVRATEARRSSRNGTAVAEIDIEVAASGAELVMIELSLKGDRRRLLTVAPHTIIAARMPLAHSGPQVLVSGRSRLAAADAAFVTAAQPIAPLRAIVHPTARPVPALPLPARLSGLTGAHASTRLGDGGEFRDIHPFTAGDRLRRIDWKATARWGRGPGDLYVRRTHATSDLDVALVLDDGDEITGAVAEWFSITDAELARTTLDVAREAAWSLAVAYLDAADQVSFQLLSRVRGAVPRGAGSRHRERLRAAIAATGVQPRSTRYVRTPLVAAGAMVVVLSPFLDDDVVHLIALWRASGHSVLAVDTLPAASTSGLDRPERAAARMVLGERDDRLHDIRAVGADVLAWDVPPGQRAANLRLIARSRRRP